MPNAIKWQQKSLSYIFNVSSTNISFLLYYKPPLPHVRADLQSARIQYSIINVFAIHRHFKCLHCAIFFVVSNLHMRTDCKSVRT